VFESEKLNILLQYELANGNEIAENTDWLPKCKKLIILKGRFHKKYDLSEIQYREINDSHYWFSEYATLNNQECLACK
jgi:hypothetical protein